MLHPPQWICLNSSPVDAALGALIYQPADCNVVAPDQVQPVLNLLTWLVGVRRTEDALYCARQDQIRGLVVSQKLAGQRAAVGG
jgi:hypothetical protein